MKTGFSILAFTVALAGVCAPAATAQQSDNQFLRSRYVAVDDRPQPEFDPEPIHAGAFDVYSSLGLEARYNDNIYAQETGAVEDTILAVAPRVEAKTTWSVHELAAGASAEHREYLENGDESATDYSGFLRGRLDVTREAWIGATVNGGRFTEQRYEPSSQNATIEPTEYGVFNSELSASLRRNRIMLLGRVGLTTNDFDDAGLFDQDFRDVDQSYVNARASYALSPDFAVFVQGGVDELDFEETGALLGTRDATRTNGQVGMDFELGAPFRGDIAVGYVEEDKDSALRPDSDGVSVDANLKWFPTQLTTLTFNGRRSIYDPGLVESASVYATTFAVRADHELRRNILLFGEARMTKDDYQDIVREDDRLELGFGLGYKLNRNARLELGYTLRNQDSNVANRSFDQNIVSAGLKLFP